MEREPLHPDLDAPEYFDRLEDAEELEREQLMIAVERFEALARKANWSDPLKVVRTECEFLGTFLATEETDAEETIQR